MGKVPHDEIHAGIPNLRRAILRHARSSMARRWSRTFPREQFFAVALAARDRLIDIAADTFDRYDAAGAKRAYYLSMEFLLGRALGNNLLNLGILSECRDVLAELGTDLDDVLDEERDAGLGNGGLGRLAACFIDSLATLGMPGFGYGINYEYGLFRQEIVNGEQVECPDAWRKEGTPWEIERLEEAVTVRLYGRVEAGTGPDGGHRPTWVETKDLLGVPFDMPIAGYGGRTVNSLRLFSARATDAFDMQIFNEGDYVEALEEKVLSETVSRVLYPSTRPEFGPELRLVQEYFLVACSLADILRRTPVKSLEELPDKVAIQLNDTHPALAVPEFMRILVDDHQLPWSKAWDITTRILSYTNHTLLPEALERWPVPLVRKVLPRHLQIIHEINRRFLEHVHEVWPEDPARAARMSIIEETEPKQVRMANLAIIGGHSVNGVAAVHSGLVETRLVPDFHELWPEKFSNKTNGVTPRRWIAHANPSLTSLITETIGDEWIADLERIRELEPAAKDAGFKDRFLAVKASNKSRMAKMLEDRLDIALDRQSIFDTLAKRIHEYKRQTLKLLHVAWDYLRITEDGHEPAVPRTVLLAGKAAPGYGRAKEIIRLTHAIGDIVNDDERASRFLKLVFVPNYCVTIAERLIPATDLSEQISTAGFEASGTGNMKFAMNGALTIGTMDGANIEMVEEVGGENFFIFGNTVEQIQDLNARGVHPRSFYEGNDRVRRILDAFAGDRFSPGEPGRHRWVFDSLVDSWDPYFHLADLDAYLDAQERAAALFASPQQWAEKAILNVARMGKFSSDRTIREYASEIWNIHPVL